MTTKHTPPDQKSEDFKNLIDLLAIYSEADATLAQMTANLNSDVIQAIDGYKDDYAGMQKTLVEAEQAAERIALRHPEWFTEKKSVKTPYGTVKFHRSNPVQVGNEELSIELIKRDAAQHGLEPGAFIRQREVLNIEALETLTPEQLKAFRLTRVAKENFSITPARVDLGKAVKEAAEKREVAP